MSPRRSIILACVLLPALSSCLLPTSEDGLDLDTPIGAESNRAPVVRITAPFDGAILDYYDTFMVTADITDGSVRAITTFMNDSLVYSGRGNSYLSINSISPALYVGPDDTLTIVVAAADAYASVGEDSVKVTFTNGSFSWPALSRPADGLTVIFGNNLELQMADYQPNSYDELTYTVEIASDSLFTEAATMSTASSYNAQFDVAAADGLHYWRGRVASPDGWTTGWSATWRFSVHANARYTHALDDLTVIRDLAVFPDGAFLVQGVSGSQLWFARWTLGASSTTWSHGQGAYSASESRSTVDANGDVFVLTPTSSYDNDVVLIKMHGDGIAYGTRTYSGWDTPTGIRTTSEFGMWMSFDNYGGPDLVRTDTEGNVIVQMTLGPLPGAVDGIELADNGSRCIYYGRIANQDLRIAEIDTNFGTIWERAINYNGTSYRREIAVGPDGACTAALTVSDGGTYRTYLHELAQDGSTIWIWDSQLAIPQYSSCDLASLCGAPDGGVVILATCRSSSSSSGSVMYVARLALDGNLVWERTFQGLDHSVSGSVVAMQGERIVVAGTSSNSEELILMELGGDGSDPN